MIWNTDIMKETLMELNIDVDKMPIGHMNKEYIVRAYKVLKDIENMLLSGTVGGKENQINQLTNDFYTLIPHNFGIKKATIIDHLLRVKEKLKALDILSDIQVT